MEAFLDYIIDSIVNIVMALVNDAWEILKDIVFLVFDQVLDLMGWVLSLIGSKLPDMDMVGYWSMVPQDLIQILSYIDFAECMALITASIGIRLGLNIIPFVK